MLFFAQDEQMTYTLSEEDFLNDEFPLLSCVNFNNVYDHSENAAISEKNCEVWKPASKEKTPEEVSRPPQATTQSFLLRLKLPTQNICCLSRTSIHECKKPVCTVDEHLQLQEKLNACEKKLDRALNLVNELQEKSNDLEKKLEISINLVNEQSLFISNFITDSAKKLKRKAEDPPDLLQNQEEKKIIPSKPQEHQVPFDKTKEVNHFNQNFMNILRKIQKNSP